MSKSPKEILLPVLGGTALFVGLAYGIANRDYGADKIETLEARVEQVSKQAVVASNAAQVEAARSQELESKIAEIQDLARAQAAGGGLIKAPAPNIEGRYDLGRSALPEEIAAWDIDILPDGRGLPVGKGDVWTGEEVFANVCASCHGDFAEGVDNWPVLAGGFDTLADKDPVKTVGSYWPYLSTVWDYVNRSMPFGGAQTLTDDEVYAIVAYILYSNDIVDEDFELSHDNFMDVPMHNAEGFVVDDRAATEYTAWRRDPCMENCKETAEITMRASILDVTPEEDSASSSETDHTAAPSAANDSQPVTEVAAVADMIDPALIEAGEKLFKRCAACHAVGAGAKHKSGPHLNAILGRTIGSTDGFKFSSGFKAAGEAGQIWDELELATFLAKPKDYIKGTKMSFAGFKSDEDLDAIIAYLKAASE